MGGLTSDQSTVDGEAKSWNAGLEIRWRRTSCVATHRPHLFGTIKIIQNDNVGT